MDFLTGAMVLVLILGCAAINYLVLWAVVVAVKRGVAWYHLSRILRESQRMRDMDWERRRKQYHAPENKT